MPSILKSKLLPFFSDRKGINNKINPYLFYKKGKKIGAFLDFCGSIEPNPFTQKSISESSKGSNANKSRSLDTL